jgi:multidrug efflux system membrane fusion protein
LFVYVVKPDSTVAVAQVTLGLDTGAIAVIESGLTEADTIVLNGQSRLRPGARVAPAAAAAS